MTELERELEANEKMWRATTVLSHDELKAQIAYDRNRIMRKHGETPSTFITSPVYSPAERTDGFKAR